MTLSFFEPNRNYQLLQVPKFDTLEEALSYRNSRRKSWRVVVIYKRFWLVPPGLANHMKNDGFNVLTK